MNTQNTTLPPAADALEARLDALSAQIGYLVEQQRRQQELLDEVGPILKEVMAVLVVRMDELERRGYFAFGRETLGVLDQIVTSYSAEDVRALGQNIVRILDTVRAVTQPEVLELAAEAAEAVHHAEAGDHPKGLLGMLKGTRDDDVRRGMAVMLEVLRHVGRGASRVAQASAPRALVPRRAPTPTPPAPRSEATPQRPARAVPHEEAPSIDPAAWTPEAAQEAATSLGLGALTEGHWRLVQVARQDFEAQGHSPNIRRLSQLSGMHTREIYALFPKAPGVAIARVAGIPRPVGCI